MISWAPVFYDGKNRVLMGGNLVVTVSTKIGEKTYGDYREYQIKGLNPDKSEVKSQLGSLPYQIIAYKESGFIQFKNGEPYNSAGEEGASLSGYGIMQLDPASYQQVWNWRKNVEGGITHFKENQKDARKKAEKLKNYFKKLYSTPQNHEDVKDLDEKQILTQAFYEYNAGDAFTKNGKLYTYWAWDPNTDSWTVNPDAYQPGVDYANEAIAIYDNPSLMK